MRSFFLIIAHLVVFSTAASAAPLTGQSRTEVIEEAKTLLGAARSHVTSVQGKYQTDLRGTETAQSSKERALNGQADNQRRALQLLEDQLEVADTELFTVNSQIRIIPSLVRFSEQLVSMTQYYREQSGFPNGPETLGCGDSCQFYQKRRDALSSMITGLGEDLMNIAEIVRNRRLAVEQIALDIGTVERYPSSSLVRFGFDHFINQRLARLEGQSSIVEDVHRLGAQANFAGQPESVPQPCFPGQYLYRSFLNDINGLANITDVWRAPVEDVKQTYNVNLWARGQTGAIGPLQQVRNQYIGHTDADGRYRPGWFDNWGGCSQSIKNVIRLKKAGVEVELRNGNPETAKSLDEDALDLQVEVESLDEQVNRLRQFDFLLQQLASVAFTHAASPKSDEAWTDMWKSSVLSEIKNFERLSVAQREILIAAQALVLLAEEEIAPLGTISDADQRAARLLSAKRRLGVIAEQGFERLERELSFAATSLDVMSDNIRSSEGSNNQGGLGLAISSYEETAIVRNNQMKQEKDIELPARREKARATVSELEKSRASTVTLLTEIESKQATLRSLIEERERLRRLLDGFFGVQVSHPFYLDLGRKFVTELKVSKAAERSYRRAVDQYVKNFSTLGSFNPSSQSIPVTTIGKRAQNLRGQYQRRISKVADGLSTPQLGGISFSKLLGSLKEIRAKANAL